MSTISLFDPYGFTQGQVTYLDDWPGENSGINRIIVPIQLGQNSFSILAMVDTGSQYCILRPEHASNLNIDYYQENLERKIGGGIFIGKLGRLEITIPASKGDSITVDATVWVPGQHSILPNILGLTGFLERIHFAVNPYENLFYFGDPQNSIFE